MPDLPLWPLASASPPLEMPLLAAVMESAPDAWWIVGQDLSLTYFNSTFRRICLKLTRVEPEAGMPLERMLDPVKTPRLHAHWSDIYRRILNGRTISSEDWYQLGQTRRFFTISGSPVIVNGVVSGAALHARDVTDWQRESRQDFIELALTRLFGVEDPLSETIERAIAFICEADSWDAAIAWLVDAEGTTLEPSVIWTGEMVQSEDFRGRLSELRFPLGRGLPGRCWAAEDVIAIADLMEETGMIRGTIASGVGLHAVVAVPLSDAGRVIGVLELFTGPVRPLSEQHKMSLRRVGASLAHLISRRRAEIERGDLLQIIERKGTEWAHTFDSIELPIFLTAADGSIVRLNRAARDFAGLRYRELTGHPINDIHQGEPWKTLGDVVSAVRDSGTPCTARIYDPAADRTWDVSGSISRATPSGDERLILVLAEITAMVRLQESVARGEQLAALGELVAGVAHQVRNPIFGISALLDGLEQRIVVDSDTTEMMTAIRRWLERLSLLMESLLQYGRAWRLDLTEGDVAVVLRQAAQAMRLLAEGAKVEIGLDVQDGLPALMDPGRLAQAFENLITNAIQHSHAGGHVMVSARRAPDAGGIECTVRDEGVGFLEADLPRVFHPFFTRRRGGTGLGLSIVQRIIEEHGGTIAADNHPDGGAVMTVSLPVYRRPAQETIAGE